MKKKLKYAILAFWPIVSMIFIILWIKTLGFFEESGYPLALLDYIPIILLFSIYVPVFIYWKYLYGTKIEQIKKTWWSISFLIFSFVTMPIYWYFYIWKSNEKRKK